MYAINNKMIIGAALVVDELRKGQRLAFRYPASIPSAILNSHPALLAFHQDYLSLSPDNFAKIFRPKAALFNKIFELTIDDVHYISYPCPCVEKGEENSIEYNNLSSNNDVITLFNVVIATVRESAMKRVLGEAYTRFFNTSSNKNTKTYIRKDFTNDANISGTDPVAITMGLSNSISILSTSTIRKVVESFSKALLVQEKRHRYVSRQVAIMLRTLESNSQVIKSNPSSTNANDTGDIDESRQDNMKQQVKLQNHIVMDENRDLQCMDIMLQQSSLANELRLIFHGLIGGHSLSLTVNNALNLNMSLHDVEEFDEDDSIKPYHTLLLIGESNVIFSIISNMYTSSSTDDTHILSRSERALTCSKISPLIKKVINSADPTKSFLDLSISLEEPLSELYAIARHLQHWGLAKVITTITASNRYRVHLNAPIEVESKVAKAFSAIFSNVKKQVNTKSTNNIINGSSPSKEYGILSSNDQLSIARILSCFNGIRTVSEAVECFPHDYTDYAIDIIVWLLRWRMICEVHTSLIRTDPNNDIETNTIQQSIVTPTKVPNSIDNDNDIPLNEDLTIEEEIIFEKLKGFLIGKKYISLLDIQLKEGINEQTIRSIISKRQDEIEIIDFSDFND